VHHICSPPLFQPASSYIDTYISQMEDVHVGYLYNLLHPSSPKSKTVTIHTLITLKDHLKHYFCLFFIYHQCYTAKRTLQFFKCSYYPPTNYIENYAATKELFFPHQSITNILKLNCIHTCTINKS